MPSQALLADQWRGGNDPICQSHHAGHFSDGVLGCFPIEIRAHLSGENDVAVLNRDVDRIVANLPPKNAARPGYQFIIERSRPEIEATSTCSESPFWYMTSPPLQRCRLLNHDASHQRGPHPKSRRGCNFERMPGKIARSVLPTKAAVT